MRRPQAEHRTRSHPLLDDEHGTDRRFAGSLRNFPVVLVLYLAVVDLAGVLAVAGNLTAGLPISRDEWLRFGILCAAAQIQQASSLRRRRRRTHGRGSADMSGVFLIPAAMLLPPVLAISLILAVRGVRQLVVRKPLFLFTFSTASVVLAACAAHAVFRTVSGSTTPAEAGVQIALVLSGLVYIGQQVVTTAGAVVLSAPASRPPLHTILGDRDGLVHVTTGVGLGVVLTATAAPPFMVILTLALVLAHGHLVGEVEIGRHDGGTGLATKARWTELAENRIADARAQGTRPTVLVIDLDHFKQVNDTYGHMAGDALLQEVADVLRKVVRSEDPVGRFGGEEFVVLLGDGEHAGVVAERTRAEIARIEVLCDGGPGKLPVFVAGRTASVGVAMAPAEREVSLGELMRAADHALYAAKKAGRNRVTHAPEARWPTTSATDRWRLRADALDLEPSSGMTVHIR
ncbi:GGDEF domain-containing protein [Lentzea roselyniae]|uniref:GGDEF domain-containing protein n=1 Tax=Lentzea roselyniae TaxID=531940 RepID=A0ABP7C6V3_9PSEU